MTMIRVLLGVAVLVLAGCMQSYTLVKPERQTVGGVISVEPGMKWSKVLMSGYSGKVEVWTQDGLALNTLLFIDGVADGEPLFTVGRSGGETKPPVFRSTMNPLEVEELLQATATLYFQTTLAQTHDLKPATVGERGGFRFETRLVGRDEVERDGLFVGTIRNGKLYGAWFQGARLHYFYRYLPEFERMVATAQLVGEAAK